MILNITKNPYAEKNGKTYDEQILSWLQLSINPDIKYPSSTNKNILFIINLFIN